MLTSQEEESILGMRNIIPKSKIAGWIVSWTPPRRVGLNTILNAAKGTIGEDLVKATMAPTTAISRAIKKLRKQFRHDYGMDLVCKEFDEDSGVLRIQLTEEVVQAGTGVAYKRVCAFDYDLQTYKVSGAFGLPVSVSAEDTRNKLQDFLDEAVETRVTSDISLLVQKFFKEHGRDLIPIRSHGGAYFVPHTEEDLLKKAALFLGAISGTLTRFAVTLGDTESETAVAETIAAHMNELVAALNEKSMDLWAGSRRDAKANRFKEVGDLRERLKMYSSMLGGWAGVLEKSLEDSEALIFERLAVTSITPTVDEDIAF